MMVIISLLVMFFGCGILLMNFIRGEIDSRYSYVRQNQFYKVGMITILIGYLLFIISAICCLFFV